MKNILLKGLLVSASVLLVTSSASAMTCTNLTKALSKGSENSEVLKLQQFLFDGGYLTAKPNGYFGAGTVTAVKKFQGMNGLTQVGSVGPGTRNKIKIVSCDKDISSLNNIKVSTSTLLSKISNTQNSSKSLTLEGDIKPFTFDNAIEMLKTGKGVDLSVYAIGLNDFGKELLNMQGFTPWFIDTSTTSETLFKIKLPISFSTSTMSYLYQDRNYYGADGSLFRAAPVLVKEKYCKDGFKTTGNQTLSKDTDLNALYTSKNMSVLVDNISLLKDMPLISHFSQTPPGMSKDSAYSTYANNLKQGVWYFTVEEDPSNKDLAGVDSGVYCPGIIMSVESSNVKTPGNVDTVVSYFVKDQKVNLKVSHYKTYNTFLLSPVN